MCNVVLCRSGVQLYSGVQYSWWGCSRPQLGRATSWEETLTTHHRCDAGFLHENLIFNIDNNTNNNNSNSSWRRTSRKNSTTQNTNVAFDLSEKLRLWYRVLRSVRWQKYRCGALLRWLGSNLLLTTCHHSGCTIPPSFSWPPRHSQFYYSEKTESRPNTCHCQNYKKSQQLQQVLAARESVFSQYQCQWLQVSFNLLLCGLLWGVWFLFNWFNISSKKESTKSRIAATTRWFCSISVFKTKLHSKLWFGLTFNLPCESII